MERRGPVISALVYRMATGARAAAMDGVTWAMEAVEDYKLLDKKTKRERRFDSGLAGELDTVCFPPLPQGGDSRVPPKAGKSRSKSCATLGSPTASWPGPRPGRPGGTARGSPTASLPGSGWSTPRSWAGKVLKLADGGIFSTDDRDDAASVASSIAAPLSEDGIPLPPAALALGEDLLRHRSCSSSNWASQTMNSPNSWMKPRSRCRRTRLRHS